MPDSMEGAASKTPSYSKASVQAARETVAGKLLDPLQRYTVPEASAYLRQSLALTNRQIADGEIKVIRVGGRVYVPGTEIARLSSLATAPEGRRNRRGRWRDRAGDAA